MPGEDRRDYREIENVTIIVNGDDPKGHPFEEQTESINISSVGISFFLKNSITLRSFISIQLSKSDQFGYLSRVSAVVVRVETISPEKYMVAAEFI